MRSTRLPPEIGDAVTSSSKWLELGCGNNKIHPDVIGVDALAFPQVDVIGPIPEVLESIEGGSIDVIYSNHFLEHVDDLSAVMAASARLLCRGGRFVAVVPHFSNPYFYSDPTHSTSFGLYSMSYYSHDDLHRRQVPKYVIADDDVRFDLTSVEIRFSRSWRRPVSRILGSMLATLTQRSARFREFYEFRLTWLVPCSEIRFELERR